MQGRRSLQGVLLPSNDNIVRIRQVTMIDNENRNRIIQQDPEGPVAPAEHIKTMKDYNMPIVNNFRLCIMLDMAARNYELKSFCYNLLPTFHDLPNEDVLKFLREFYTAIESFPNNWVTEDQLRMRCIPHALNEKGKTWLLTLPSVSLRTWDDVVEKLTNQYYSPQKTSEIRSMITNFFQGQETFYEAYERYKMLLFDCLQHGYQTHQFVNGSMMNQLPALIEIQDGKRSKISPLQHDRSSYDNMIEQLKEDKKMVVALNSDLTIKINELMEEKVSSLRKYVVFSQELEELKDEFA
ncbi:hypothetical protein Dsin_019444 [Dipteronia sinensis]|uniref:Retrotransposon gag domain-containing protein n=1 Tax=Dipteronia sinensis TaxID=43782 RepID=A0AAE0A8M0_9ROSI|nr:hypothetical protein Dsin_019444 [Dipteronia sinensis]